ncbi:methionyl-tRNA formyltransferase [Kribbella sp. CA-293567]|uniref:methionyl-tRNA formyltransferase n=1 Tax=Kribbella sp. CA-293567 TaxID=3002436 RepID=UPI0022DCF467|nr:formyltransferase family protein [Kribbella sp. CA-293567]WBQ04790.1 formyltransferase family protein [Kribbella sp. CA-293567]
MRIVTMNAFWPGYANIAGWAEEHGHEIVLVVTPPAGAGDRYDAAAKPFLLELPRTADVLVTGKLRTVAAAAIAALEPDLVISAAFPRLIPAEILKIPVYGAVNLHPSPLPAGRGPNPVRLVYEGATTVGATLHRTEAEFDTGAILSQRERPLPADLAGPAIFQAWREMLREVLVEGAARAFAGEQGSPQDPALASEAPMFTPEEQVLRLTDPGAVLVRKSAALNVLEAKTRVIVAGIKQPIRLVELVSAGERTPQPGEVVGYHTDGWTVRSGDGVVRLYRS